MALWGEFAPDFALGGGTWARRAAYPKSKDTPVAPDFDSERGLKGSSFVHRNTELTTLVHWRSRAEVCEDAADPDPCAFFRETEGK
jgi:hypothetical protein